MINCTVHPTGFEYMCVGIKIKMSSYLYLCSFICFLSQDVGILINGSVPDLAHSLVECEYGPGVSTDATVHLDYGPAQIQTCPLLSRENYQPILPGTGKTEHAFIWQCARLISLQHTSTVTECDLKEEEKH